MSEPMSEPHPFDTCLCNAPYVCSYVVYHTSRAIVAVVECYHCGRFAPYLYYKSTPPEEEQAAAAAAWRAALEKERLHA